MPQLFMLFTMVFNEYVTILHFIRQQANRNAPMNARARSKMAWKINMYRLLRPVARKIRQQ